MISPRQKRQIFKQTFNGPVGEINGSNAGPGFEGQTSNGSVGVVSGSDQASSQVTTGITSNNPNANPSASGISPQEFVNDLGIRYKGNYFNMHLNTKKPKLPRRPQQVKTYRKSRNQLKKT